MWSGTLRNRCVYSPDPDGLPPIDNYTVVPAEELWQGYNPFVGMSSSPQDFGTLNINIEHSLCSLLPPFMAGYTCCDPRGNGSQPASWFSQRACEAEGGRGYIVCMPNVPAPQKNPSFDTLGFDHFLQAILTVFCNMTLSNWSYTFYNVWRGYSAWVAGPYFFVIHVTLALCAVNLFLAVIANQLEEQPEKVEELKDDDEDWVNSTDEIFEKMSQLRERRTQHLARRSVRGSRVLGEASYMNEKSMANIVMSLMIEKHFVTEWSLQHKIDRTEEVKEFQDEQRLASDCVTARKALIKTVKVLHRRKKWLAGKPRCIHVLHRLVLSTWFNNLVLIVILINTCLLMCDCYALTNTEEAETVSQYMDIASDVMAFIFLLELILWLLGIGPRQYFREKFNRIDSIIVLFGVAEVFFTRYMRDNFVHMASAFRALRVLRVLKLTREVKTLRILINAVADSMAQVSYMLTMHVFMVFIFAVVGVQLFRSSFPRIEGTEYIPECTDSLGCRTNCRWQTVYWGFFNVFQVMTVDDWPNILYDAVHRTNNSAYTIYFVVCVLVGNYVSTYMFIALILGHFQNQNLKKFDFEDLSLAVMYTCNDKRLLGIDAESLVKVMADRQEAQPGPPGPRRVSEAKKISIRASKASHAVAFAALTTEQMLYILDSPVSADMEVHFARMLERKRKKRVVSLGKSRLNRNAPDEDNYTSLSQRSMCLFKLSNPLRRLSFSIVQSTTFNNLVFVIILLNCLQLALQCPATETIESFPEVMLALDYVFAVIFTMEMLIKMLALGVVFGSPECYLRTRWNVIDAVVVMFSWLTLLLPAPYGHAFSAFRALRPMRIVVRNRKIKVIVDALTYALPSIANVIMFILVTMIIFGILGVNLFKGVYRECMDIERDYKRMPYHTPEDCMSHNFTWENPTMQNFDNIFFALLSLFQIMTLSSWTDVMYGAIRGMKLGKSPLNLEVCSNFCTYVARVLECTWPLLISQIKQYPLACYSHTHTCIDYLSL